MADSKTEYPQIHVSSPSGKYNEAFSTTSDLANANIQLVYQVRELKDEIKRLSQVNEMEDVPTKKSIDEDPNDAIPDFLIDSVNDPNLRLSDDFQSDMDIIRRESQEIVKPPVGDQLDSHERILGGNSDNINNDRLQLPPLELLGKYYTDVDGDKDFESTFPSWGQESMMNKSFRKLTIMKNISSMTGVAPNLVYKDEFEVSDENHTPRLWRIPGIKTGYRCYFSYLLCLKSLFHIHNETGNIWSHLIGLFLAIGFCIESIITLNDPSSSQDWWMLFTYCTTTIVCMLCSSSFHTFYCHSFHSHHFFWRIDIAGVIILIAGHEYAALYFAFYCQPILKAVSFTIIVTLNILALFIVCSNIIRAKIAETFYKILMVTLSVVVFATFIYLAVSGETQEVKIRFAVPALSSVLSCGIGFLFYITAFPESKYPGKFDIWGHSHQIWHLFVLAGSLNYIFNLRSYLAIRGDVVCPL